MNNISGFLVLRKPDQNFDADGRGAFSSKAPRIGSIHYGGVFRMPWFDLDEDYYSKTLPEDLLSLRKKIEESGLDFSGVYLCYDLYEAKKILQWCNRNDDRNELAVVRSNKLSEIKGVTIPSDEISVEWLGFDFVALGKRSLLEHGMFAAPSSFLKWEKKLNRNGLMSDNRDLLDFAADYVNAANNLKVEELTEGAYAVDAIEIGRVLLKD